MPRGGMRSNSHQAKPGAGRPTLWDEYTAKSKLQKYAPKAFKTFGQKAEVDPFFADKLVKKFVADKHQTEIDLGGRVTINLDPSGFIPPVGGVITTSTDGIERPEPVQDASLAPPSPQDDHSTNGAGQASPS